MLLLDLPEVHPARGLAALASLSCLVIVSACSTNGGGNAGAPGGHDGADAADGGPVIDDGMPHADPGQIALRVERARQARGFDDSSTGLQLSVSIANGSGGVPLFLNPLLLRLKTADGLLKLPSVTPPSRRWLDGHTPNPTDQLAGGATYSGWLVGFAVDAASSRPVALIYTEAGAAAEKAFVSADRSATAPVVIDPCTACGSACTYFDHDAERCCDDLAAPIGGRCELGAPTCPAGLTSCAFGAKRACVNLQINIDNCGRCGQVSGGQCVHGVPVCAAGLTACGSECVDVQTSSSNCGRCGVQVPAGSGCNAGQPGPINTCSSTTRRDECVGCCYQLHSKGNSVIQAAFEACACVTPGTCATACAASYCANGGTIDAACDACLNGATGCESAAVTACHGDPDCVALIQCENLAHCAGKPM